MDRNDSRYESGGRGNERGMNNDGEEGRMSRRWEGDG